ncbi:hypothetical protein FFWV33_00890 [Flavobacterium faecale]|uniref:Uncharacterized protein n=1 Tax=Flavobacterium faecale TaxID=1355330 RepID=A0A2S1L8U9_9FLAO|nr:hypothetical protein FFWV33_00890 [Flavobacterium faecale]
MPTLFLKESKWLIRAESGTTIAPLPRSRRQKLGYISNFTTDKIITSGVTLKDPKMAVQIY